MLTRIVLLAAIAISGCSAPDSPDNERELCLSDTDCEEGYSCEGPGCGNDQPGVCVPFERICSADWVPHCGCDSQTFYGSSSCPGRRYASTGGCYNEDC